VARCDTRHLVDSCSVSCLTVGHLIERNHVGDLLKIEWNQQGLQQFAEEAGRQTVARAQGVYDRVLSMGAGKGTAEVKGLLAHEWESEFGTVPTDPDLTNVASELAAGHRVEVRVGPTAGL
jgi:hypothetical protein